MLPSRFGVGCTPIDSRMSASQDDLGMASPPRMSEACRLMGGLNQTRVTVSRR